MAGATLFTLIDDIASLLDDVSAMTKVAAQKTAGVLGDDLALNANQVAGVNADRELPVVWAVAKGSAVNKLILVPVALALSFFLPWAVTVLLMLGGLYLCYEGVEKLAHRFLHKKEEDEQARKEHTAALADPAADPLAVEKEKVKGAIRTDFVLSAEIVVIALGTVAGEEFLTRVIVVAAIAAVMTVGVYGFVAGIVKLDDAGLYLSKKGGAAQALGRGLLWLAPALMKFLSVAGTVAMFLVGGGILSHGFTYLHHLVESVGHAVSAIPGVGGILGSLASAATNIVAGVIAGAVVLGVVMLGKRLFNKGNGAAAH